MGKRARAGGTSGPGRASGRGVGAWERESEGRGPWFVGAGPYESEAVSDRAQLEAHLELTELALKSGKGRRCAVANCRCDSTESELIPITSVSAFLKNL